MGKEIESMTLTELYELQKVMYQRAVDAELDYKARIIAINLGTLKHTANDSFYDWIHPSVRIFSYPWDVKIEYRGQTVFSTYRKLAIPEAWITVINDTYEDLQNNKRLAMVELLQKADNSLWGT